MSGHGLWYRDQRPVNTDGQTTLWSVHGHGGMDVYCRFNCISKFTKYNYDGVDMKNAALDAIIGESKAIKQIKKLIMRISGHTDMTVLITGETGTGKELVANALHTCSGRRRHEIVRINCSAIPANMLESTLFGHKKGAFTGAMDNNIGLVEAAHKGTLFLDEISEMDIRLQPKLLRFLENGSYRRLGEVQERQVDAWVLAATNRNLKQCVRDKTFREDLYYRLNDMEIILPPLRDRIEDIPKLVQHFCQCRSNGNGQREIIQLDDKLLDIFGVHDWPGNVRELKKRVQQLSLDIDIHTSLSNVLKMKANGNSGSLPDRECGKTLKEIEYEYICRVLEQNNYQIRKCAQILGVDRNTLKKKIRQFDIKLNN